MASAQASRVLITMHPTQGHKCSGFLLSVPSTLADVPWELGAPFISFLANQI